MSKNLSAKYRGNKGRLQKKVSKISQIFSTEEKKRSSNMVMNVTKISQKTKNKRLMSIEKNVTE